MLKFDKYSARKWTNIIIHHSYSPDSDKSYQWDEIAKWHVVDNGWASIGYNFGIEMDDRGRYGYCIGRGLDCIGAHTKGMNETAMGIVLVGNYDIEEPLDCQYWLLAELCKDLMRDFKIPIENIKRHSDYAPKTCPGLKFDLAKLIEKIKNNGYIDPFSKGSEIPIKTDLKVDLGVNPVNGGDNDS